MAERAPLLTLVDQLRIGDFTVYRDVVRSGDDRTYSSTFYAIPDVPRVAMDTDGGPLFDFLWYRAPPEMGAVPDAGGIVMLTIELGPTDEQRAELVAGIRAAVAQLDTEPRVLSVPIVDGRVQLTFAGDLSGDLAASAPTAPASLQGTQRATFVVPLGRDGAGLLHQALEAGLELFHARYELTFVHRLDEVSLRVWCDSRRAHDLAVAQSASGALDPGALTTALVANRVGGVELVTSRLVDDEQRRVLEDIGTRLLAAAVGASMIEGGPSDGRLRPHSPGMDASLNLTFEESYPVEVHTVAEDTVRLGASIAELGDRIRLIDLAGGFFRVLEVKVLCTVDFDAGPIESVRVVVTYDATGATRVVRSAELVFRAGSGPQTFRTDLATPDQRSVSYEAEVFYRDGGPPLQIRRPATDTQLIVLDLEGAGVLQVDATLRDLPVGRLLTATVELRHEPSGADATFVLDQANPAAAWTTIVREATGPYRYRVTWADPDGARTATEWVESAQRELTLDAPRQFFPAADVHIVAAGDFRALAELVAELRVGDAAPTSFTFTASGQEAIWQPPTGTAAAFSYEVRQWLVHPDGTRDELPWASHDGPVLVVGDLLRFDVVVTPRLLGVGTTVTLAMVELVADETDDPGSRTTLVFRDAQPQTWSMRMRTQGAHGYAFRVTLVRAAGQRDEGAWQRSDSGVLVLRPIETPPES